MAIDLSEDAIRKRRIFLELNEEAYQLWRHEPVTMAFLQFLADQIDTARDVAADLIEEGLFERGKQEQNLNPDVLRGKIIAWRDLHKLTLQAIHAAYSEAEPIEDDLGRPFREDDE